MPSRGSAQQVYFEIVRIGAAAKVSAIDAATGLEVSVTGPATTDDATLKAAALRKLEYMRAKGASKPK